MSYSNSLCPSPNIDAARRFLTMLDESDDSFVFQTFDDSPKKDKSLAKVLIGTLDHLHHDLARLNARKAGVFVTVNRTDGKGRKKENIVAPRCVFCEWDSHGRVLPEWPLEPHIIVETSPGNFHIYWIADGLSLEDYDALMATMVSNFGSDKNAKDRARVLRLPGFWHNKADPVQVTIIESNPSQPYSRDELFAAFKPATKPTVETAIPLAPVDRPDDHWRGILIRIVSEHAARTWTDAATGRHSQILSLGYSFAERGIPDSYDEQALRLFESLMRPTDTQGNPAPLNFEQELKAIQHGRLTAIGKPSVLHGQQLAEMLFQPPPPAPVVAVSEIQDIPAELLLPPGLLGEYVKWTCRTSRFPQPFLAVGNGLALFGAIIGQTARTETDLRTNLYTLGISPSASGKDHSRKCAKRVLTAAGLQTRLGGENLASDTGLLDAVFRSPACLFQIDEFGRVLKTLTKPEKSHLYAIPTALMQLYSAANDLFLGKEYAGLDTSARKDIDQPCACLYGTTVPSHFFKALTHDEAEDGFLARFLIFQGEDDPIEQTPSLELPPQALVDAIGVVAMQPKNVAPKGNYDAVAGITPLIYPCETAATLEFQDLSKLLQGQRKQHRRDRTDAIWGRCWEHAAKVALILAATAGRELHTITVEDAHYGIELAKWSCNTMAHYVATHVAENETESVTKRVEQIIKAAGKEGITMTELYAKTRFLKRRERAEVVDDLKDSGLVVETVTAAKNQNPKGTKVIVHVAAR